MVTDPNRVPSSWLERGTDRVHYEQSNTSTPQWKLDLLRRRQENVKSKNTNWPESDDDHLLSTAFTPQNTFRDASTMQELPSRDVGRGVACWNPSEPSACSGCVGEIEFREPSRPPADVVDQVPGITEHGYSLSRPRGGNDFGLGVYAGPRAVEDPPNIVASKPSKVPRKPPWKEMPDDTDYGSEKGIPISGAGRAPDTDRGGQNCCFRNAPCQGRGVLNYDAGTQSLRYQKDPSQDRPLSSAERRHRSNERRFCEVPGLSNCFEPEFERDQHVRTSVKFEKDVTRL